MFTIEAHRLGGAAANKVCYERAKALYYASPNYCQYCGKIIQIVRIIQDARRKKFCNQSCAASFNNKKFKKRELTPGHICPDCGGRKHTTAKRCFTCERIRKSMSPERTKASLISGRKTWQSFRNAISKHARFVFKEANMEKSCFVCGYDKHTDVAHRKCVSEFPDSATIAEINALNNLCALCPNHHWEHDHSLLTL